MLIDIPECKRCVFCIPLRHGIIIFGYLNLIFSVLLLALEIWLCIGEDVSATTMGIYRGVGMYTHAWFPLMLYSVELVFNVVLVIGAHKKNKRLIRAYYYYGITTTLAAFVAFIAVGFDRGSPAWGFDVMVISLAFSGFVIQIYLLLLIRSELKKLRYEGEEMSFVNHLQEVVVRQPRREEAESTLRGLS